MIPRDPHGFVQWANAQHKDRVPDPYFPVPARSIVIEWPLSPWHHALEVQRAP